MLEKTRNIVLGRLLRVTVPCTIKAVLSQRALSLFTHHHYLLIPLTETNINLECLKSCNQLPEILQPVQLPKKIQDRNQIVKEEPLDKPRLGVTLLLARTRGNGLTGGAA